MHVMERNGVVVVTVVDDQCASLWKTLEPFIEAGKRNCVLDLSQVGFLNSVNIAAIIAARNKVVAAGGKIAVADIKDRVKSIFRVLKLDRLFDLNRNLDAAILAVG
ncbi:MAG: STAS domain-containing protein [Planctomycetes bacterium]|nr:STAS domain-containing protein [Planctomycetota bacterium]